MRILLKSAAENNRWKLFFRILKYHAHILTVCVLFLGCGDSISYRNFLERKYEIACGHAFSCHEETAKEYYGTEEECIEKEVEEHYSSSRCDLDKDAAADCFRCMEKEGCRGFDNVYSDCECEYISCW